MMHQVQDFLAVAEAKEALQAEKQGEEGSSRPAAHTLGEAGPCCIRLFSVAWTAHSCAIDAGSAMRFMPGKGNAKKKKKTCKDPDWSGDVPLLYVG